MMSAPQNQQIAALGELDNTLLDRAWQAVGIESHDVVIGKCHLMAHFHKCLQGMHQACSAFRL
jgi:hypothetical protein